MKTTNHPVPHDGVNPSSSARAPHFWKRGRPCNHGELRFLQYPQPLVSLGLRKLQCSNNIYAAAAALLLCRQQRQVRVSAALFSSHALQVDFDSICTCHDMRWACRPEVCCLRCQTYVNRLLHRVPLLTTAQC
jgi:hypothetical protein